MSTLATGCSREPPAPAHGASPAAVTAPEAPAAHPLAAFHDGGVMEFIHERFAALYPLFLERHSMPLGEKAALWQARYYGRWVRWTGKVRSFTAQGITVVMQPQAVTFDVSLWVDAAQLPEVPSLLKVGQRVTFIGKLDSYDDIWRTLYLTHGSIMAEPDPPDPHAPDDVGP